MPMLSASAPATHPHGFRRIAAAALLATAGLASGAQAVVLYSDTTVPYDWPFIDDSKLATITLDSVTIGLFGTPHVALSISNPTPVSICQNCTYTSTTGYTESFGTSVSSRINGQLVSTFSGLDAQLGASQGTTVNIGTEQSSTTSVQMQVQYCATCASFDVITRPIYDLYSGSFTWYQDSEPELFSPGFTLQSGSWTLTVFTGTRVEVANYHSFTAIPCPEPAEWAGLTAGLGVLYARRPRRRVS